jgi:hypothetical protein
MLIKEDIDKSEFKKINIFLYKLYNGKSILNEQTSITPLI